MEYAGDLNASGVKFAIIVSRFNEFFSEKLLGGALDCLKRHGAGEKDISIFRVPGSFEIPYVASRLAKDKKYDSIICLGVVIRGQTPHYTYINNEVAKVSLDTDLPVIYGVVTADTLEQAVERCGSKSGNKGFTAAMTAIEMVSLLKKI